MFVANGWGGYQVCTAVIFNPDKGRVLWEATVDGAGIDEST